VPSSIDAGQSLQRIAIAGGDSSGEVASALDIAALSVCAGLAPGAPLCRAWSDIRRRDGLELVLKGDRWVRAASSAMYWRGGWVCFERGAAAITGRAAIAVDVVECASNETYN
jgi:hypothetical protein